jgi:hypothetical protein
MNGSLPMNGDAFPSLGLKDLHVQETRGPNRPRMGQAGRTGPTGPGASRPGLVAPSLPWVLMYYALCPLQLHHFDDVILVSKMEVLLA